MKTLTFSIIALLVSATLSGCAKDAKGPFASLQDQTSPYAEAQRGISDNPPQPTIQQTAYEAQVPDPVWHDSLNTAISEAKAKDKLVLVNFTGSDWCHFCVKLKDEVFNKQDFKNWAMDNVVLLEIDSPKRKQLPAAIKEQNQMLKSRFNISSFPTVLMLDAEGNVKAKMGYEKGKSPAQWVQLAESRLQQSASRTNVARGQNGLNLR